MGREAESIYDDVRTAYVIRSKFVHGTFPSILNDTEKEFLLLRISEYLRESITIWIQLLSANHKPNDIIDIFDRTAISTETRTKLVAIIKSMTS